MSTEFFRAGDQVPAWLLDIEPKGPGEAPPQVHFSRDCYVLETKAGYWVIADEEKENGGHRIMVSGGNRVVVFAASKAVLMPMTWENMRGQDRCLHDAD